MILEKASKKEQKARRTRNPGWQCLICTQSPPTVLVFKNERIGFLKNIKTLNRLARVNTLRQSRPRFPLFFSEINCQSLALSPPSQSSFLLRNCIRLGVRASLIT